MPKKLKTRETAAMQQATGKRTIFDGDNDLDEGFDDLKARKTQQRGSRGSDEEEDEDDEDDAPEAVGTGIGRAAEVEAQCAREECAQF